MTTSPSHGPRRPGARRAWPTQAWLLRTFKDHVVFERSEVLTQSGNPYGVFTPYKNAWLQKVNAFYLRSYPVGKYDQGLGSQTQGLPGARSHMGQWASSPPI
jgi:deoxyribodipyrimidine photo-lyase